MGESNGLYDTTTWEKLPALKATMGRLVSSGTLEITEYTPASNWEKSEANEEDLWDRLLASTGGGRDKTGHTGQ